MSSQPLPAGVSQWRLCVGSIDSAHQPPGADGLRHEAGLVALQQVVCSPTARLPAAP